MPDQPPPNRDLLILRNWCHQRAQQPGADPLWRRIADEVDAYLDGRLTEQPAPPAEEEALF